MKNVSTLNLQQIEAVRTINGPLLLLAGAGTGKTRVIIHRIAHLIDCGVTANAILAVTFTNKAAREMKERIAALLGKETAGKVVIGTFHSFCNQLLRQEITRLGYGKHFAISSSAYQVGLIRNLMAERGLAANGRDPRQWQAIISNAKTAMRTPQQVGADEYLPHAAEIAEIYELYQRRMKQMNTLDFDDLLVLVLQLWSEYPEVLLKHQHKFRYLLIDEYQDTSPVQFQLMQVLAGEQQNICAVGDDDQSIYGWRGADIRNILQFKDHFANARVLRLEQNYRSTNTILQAANAVIAHNPHRHDKTLWSDKGSGERIVSVLAANEDEEAEFMADFIKDRCLRFSRSYDAFAVLLRSNYQSRAIENCFRKNRIPYTMVGTNSFFNRKEILDLISYLQLIANPKDDLSLLRIINIPPRGFGDKAIEKLHKLQRVTHMPMEVLLATPDYLDGLPADTARNADLFVQAVAAARNKMKSGPLYRAVLEFIDVVGYTAGFGRIYKPREDALRRRENVDEFLNEIQRFDQRHNNRGSLVELLEMLALIDASDQEQKSGDDGQGAVTMMTVHAAKGLEFPVILIPGLERGLFPHRLALEEGNEEEERRLFYVALTRAQEEAVLSYAEKRLIKGSMTRRRPSRFLDELPGELVQFSSARDALVPADRAFGNNALAQLKAQLGD